MSLRMMLIGFNVVVHKPNGDVALTGSVGMVADKEPDVYELFTENGIADIKMTPAEIKQLTWKETVDISYSLDGQFKWTAHFYKVRK